MGKRKSPPQWRPPRGYKEHNRYGTWRGAWQAYAMMANKYTGRIISTKDLKKHILYIRKRPKRSKKK